MTANNQIQFDKDPANKKFLITRHFNAPVDQVWNAWTQSELLDQWWAPKPYRAETKKMEFKPGGSWLYAMVGPDDSKMWCKVEYKTINPNKGFEAIDMFCDEDGNRNQEFPSMSWKNEFHSTATGSKVVIEVLFETQADMEKVVEMGIEEGFKAALVNLDELLAG